MALSRVSRIASSFSLHRPSSRPFSCSSSSCSVPHPLVFRLVGLPDVALPRNPIAAAAAAASSALSPADPLEDGTVGKVPTPKSSVRRWKPTCLYYTQGKCTMMNDSLHIEKFNHNLLMDLPVNVSAVAKVKPQKLDYFLVIDLEGKVEIIEFPVIMIDAKSMDFVDSFHRFVRPTEMSEQRIKQYIEGKYGKIGVDRVWHDTAIPFKEVLQEFEDWIGDHKLWQKEQGGLKSAAFITCGNWDLKTKVPEQCRVSETELPSYFMEWINLKDIYFNFYNRRANGMLIMMRGLGMKNVGAHHLGIDDAKNIARIVQHMLADGAVMQITARRDSTTGETMYLFKKRITHSKADG